MYFIVLENILQSCFYMASKHL